MDTNDLQGKASKLLRALEDGDANKARDMLHGEGALELALHICLEYDVRDPQTRGTAYDVLAILAAERMERETLARALGNSNVLPLGALGPNHARSHACAYGWFSGEGYNRVRVCSCGAEDHALDPSPSELKAIFGHGIVRDLAALDHGRAVAELYASDEDVEARR